MELNSAYGITENTYEDISQTAADIPKGTGAQPHPIKSAQSNRTNTFRAAVAVIITTLLAFAVCIAVFCTLINGATQEIQALKTKVGGLERNLSNIVSPKGTFLNPACSCSDIPQDSLSGEYWIQTDNNSIVKVYCDMTRSCCNSTGGWMRVANLDMTDHSQHCPAEFKFNNRSIAPFRTCGRVGPAGCVSTTYSVHNLEYSKVCGKVKGYQFGSPDAFHPFDSNQHLTIDDTYVDGVSLTHGHSPRQHIWTFACALDEVFTWSIAECDCIQPGQIAGTVPPFVADDYFCETGSRNQWMNGIFHNEDPLWDGRGCEGLNACCSFNHPPWFCKQLPKPTTDDIELRLCANFDTGDEDIPLEIVKIFIK